VLVDEDGRACLADYDFADILASSATNVSYTTSTYYLTDAIRWVAPELIVSEDEMPMPTMPSDVYSLGCVMLQVSSWSA